MFFFNFKVTLMAKLHEKWRLENIFTYLLCEIVLGRVFMYKDWTKNCGIIPSREAK